MRSVSLAHHQKRQEAVSREGKRSPTKRRFGDFRFDYLEKCRHELAPGRDPALCIFCKLVARQLDAFFEKESKEKAKAKEESAIRRTAQRYELVQNWAKNQGLFYQDLMPPQMRGASMIELSFSYSLAQALMAEAEVIEEEQQRGLQRKSEGPALDLSNMTKLLTRRRRILEVGAYAAVFLQTRIRKWCARRRVRHMLMLRFEYVPPPANQDPRRAPKKAFFVDTKSTQMWASLPSIIADQRPNTPRTIARRVGGIERRMDARLSRFKSLIKAFIVDGAYKDIWSEEEQYVSRIRSFAALLDVAQAAMRAARRLMGSEAGGGRVSQSATTDALNSAPLPPLWFSLSAPAPTARQVGLALAVETPDYRSTHAPVKRREVRTERAPPVIATHTAQSAAAPGGGSKGGGKGRRESSSTAATGSKVKTSASAVSEPPSKPEDDDNEDRGVPYYEMNASLQALEARAWDCLKCTSPDDILRKLLSPELHPPMQSCIAISLDDQAMWNGEPLTPHQKQQSDNEYFKDHPGEHDRAAFLKTKKQKGASNAERASVLPINIQLRPIKPQRDSPSCIFRLFFHEAELVAVTQTAVWALYPEILRDREGLVQAVLALTESAEIKNFVCAYFERANVPAVAEMRTAAAVAASGSAAGGAAGRRTSSFGHASSDGVRGPSSSSSSSNSSNPPLSYVDGRFCTRPQQPCTPLYVPPDTELYEMDAYFGAGKTTLTAEETVAASKAYKFLSKSPAFKALLVKAQNALMRTKRAAVPVPSPQLPSAEDARVYDLPSNSSSSSSSSSSSDDSNGGGLRGSSIYRDLCVNAPGGQGRSEEQYGDRLRGLCLLTDPTMQPRVRRPELIANSHDGLVNPSAQRFDLLVIDVTVNPPVVADTNASKSSPSFGRRTAELHAVIGMASCRTDRAPPHIDCGLLDWSFFKGLCAEQMLDEKQRGKEPVWMKPKFNWTSQAPPGQVPLWGTPDANSGVILSSNLRTATARNITVALVGGLPTHEFLVSNVPKKQQKWMNWI